MQELSQAFLLCIVHPMSEGWLLADRRGFADFFRVKESDVRRDPEALTKPKQKLLEICAGSRSRDIRKPW